MFKKNMSLQLDIPFAAYQRESRALHANCEKFGWGQPEGRKSKFQRPGDSTRGCSSALKIWGKDGPCKNIKQKIGQSSLAVDENGHTLLKDSESV